MAEKKFKFYLNSKDDVCYLPTISYNIVPVMDGEDPDDPENPYDCDYGEYLGWFYEGEHFKVLVFICGGDDFGKSFFVNCFEEDDYISFNKNKLNTYTTRKGKTYQGYYVLYQYSVKSNGGVQISAKKIDKNYPDQFTPISNEVDICFPYLIL